MSEYNEPFQKDDGQRKRPKRTTRDEGHKLVLHHYGYQQVKDAINGIDDAEVDQEMVLTDEERKKITDALQRKRKNYEQDENRKYFYRWDLFKQVGSMHVRYPVAGQYTDWVGLPNDSSEKCGFRDKASFERMNDFLEIAGPNRQLYHVHPGGNSCLEAMRYQMWVRHPGHPNLPFFPNRYARRMFVMAAVHWYQGILKEKKRMLAYSYDGSIPSMGGPYTLREYLYEMLNTRTPIDDTLLWAFAMETESAISIILEDGIVYSVTNPYDVKDCDFVLTLTRHNHFSAAVEVVRSSESGKATKKFATQQDLDVKMTPWREEHTSDTESNGASTDEELEVYTRRPNKEQEKESRGKKKSVRGKGVKKSGKKASEADDDDPNDEDWDPEDPLNLDVDYDPEEDHPAQRKKPRLSGEGNKGDGKEGESFKPPKGKAVVPKVTIQKLATALRELDQEAGTGATGGYHPIPGLEPGNPLRLPEIKSGMKRCPACDKRVGTFYTLKQHYKKHEGTADYHCQHCGRNYDSKASRNAHEQVCGTFICKEKIVILDPNGDKSKDTEKQCGMKFSTRAALTNHIRQSKVHNRDTFIAREKKYACRFGCGVKSSNPKSIKSDHEPYCDKCNDPKIKREKSFCFYRGCDKHKDNIVGFKGYRRPNQRNTHMKDKHGHNKNQEPKPRDPTDDEDEDDDEDND